MFVVFHQNILGIYALGCEPPPSESVEGKIKIVISEQKKKGGDCHREGGACQNMLGKFGLAQGGWTKIFPK